MKTILNLPVRIKFASKGYKIMRNLNRTSKEPCHRNTTNYNVSKTTNNRMWAQRQPPFKKCVTAYLGSFGATRFRKTNQAMNVREVGSGIYCVPNVFPCYRTS